MIVFRQTDRRFPVLWEGGDQPPGRWHAAGEGPAHYFAETPDGAWAEFLRHEEITDPADLATIRRQMWAVDIGDAPAASIDAAFNLTLGGPESYPPCQAAARRLRDGGARHLRVPAAALVPGGARGVVVKNGPQPAPPRDGAVIVIFGPPDSLVGWAAAGDARPPDDLLPRVRHYGAH
jgi:hypothetical protein